MKFAPFVGFKLWVEESYPLFFIERKLVKPDVGG
jgi:hypothetical protein